MPPISHITVLDVYILASVFTVMATIFQSVAVRILVQRRALFDLSRNGTDLAAESSPKPELARELKAWARRSKKSEYTSLLRTLFRYSIKVSLFAGKKSGSRGAHVHSTTIRSSDLRILHPSSTVMSAVFCYFLT